MRLMLIALTALATTAIALPIAAQAEETVIIKKDNGHHYGWRHDHRDNGHHYGWRHRHRDNVVVVKERERHRHHVTTGASVGTVGVGVRVGE